MKLADLKPAPFNPRQIADTAAIGLAESLDRFGDISGIVWNKSNGFLVTGHQRLKALQAKFNGSVTMSRGEVNTPAGSFAVRVVEWDEDKHIAAMISANNQAISGEWDQPLLKDALETLDDYPTETLLMDDLLDASVEDQAVEEVDVEDGLPVRTKAGDVWTLGRHRLMCGDCLEDSGKLLQGRKADLCVTDPPYNINLDKIDAPNRRNDGKTVPGDNQSPSEWKGFCSRVAAMLLVAVDGCVYLFHAPGPDGRMMGAALDDALHFSATIVWVKQNFVFGQAKYHSQHEPAWFGWTTTGSNFTKDRTLANVWNIDRPRRSDEHPTMKPVELIARCMQHASKKGQLVFDPFCGSGTAFLAAEQLDRTCYAMEIEPKYCDVALARWEKLTGEVAVLDVK